MRNQLAKKIRQEVSRKDKEMQQQVFNAIMSLPWQMRLRIAFKILFKMREGKAQP